MMPYYNLQVVEEVKTLSDVYADDEAALIGFGEQLGVTLTLEEQSHPAEYMMGRREESVAFIKTDTPVWRSN
jgi:hypothetical protein